MKQYIQNDVRNNWYQTCMAMNRVVTDKSGNLKK